MEKQIDTRPHFRSLGSKLPIELFSKLKTPCYIIDEEALKYNGEILSGV